jgi:hypothetical protein
MSNYTPEEQTFLVQTRARALDRTATIDELKRAIILLRANRKAAEVASATSKSKPKSKTPSPTEVSSSLADLENF